jgi:hypothetical protein
VPGFLWRLIVDSSDCSTWNVWPAFHTWTAARSNTEQEIWSVNGDTRARGIFKSHLLSKTYNFKLQVFQLLYVCVDRPSIDSHKSYSSSILSPSSDAVGDKPYCHDAPNGRRRSTPDATEVVTVPVVIGCPCVPALRMVDVKKLFFWIASSESPRCGSYTQNFESCLLYPLLSERSECAVRHLPCSTPRQ